MKPGLLLLFIFFTTKIFAQDKYVEGIVFDKDSKERIAIVHVLNASTGASIYNNLSGIFKIEAKIGDVLIFTKTDYRPDTLHVRNPVEAVYLQATGIRLKEVRIRDSLNSPMARLKANRMLYNRAYSTTANADLLTVGNGTLGFSTDALYNAFSNKGRDIARLQSALDDEYKQDVVDHRFTKTVVSRVTGLKGAQLEDFMMKYRPGYHFINFASEYEFINSIKTNLKRYYRTPDAYTLAPLNDADAKP